MLTADLVRVRRLKGKVIPAYLRRDQIEKLTPDLEQLIALHAEAAGKTVGELAEQVRELTAGAADPWRWAGFAKLLKDRCDIDESNGAEAESLREGLFTRAATERRGLDLLALFDRDAVIQECAAGLGILPAELEARLFADLPGAQVIRGFRSLGVHELCQRYNLALAQGVLLRATRVTIELDPAPAVRVRELFRRIKFCRLMHQIEGTAAEGYQVVLDGPLSLFEATQRYGVQLAVFLPVLVAGEGWRLRAEVLWGKGRERLEFVLADTDGLCAPDRDTATEPPEVAALERAFSRLESGWRLRHEATLFDMKGQGVFAPDMVFEHQERRCKVYLEVFGYWNREAVFRRVELLSGTLGNYFLLAVSRRLRVSPEVAGEEFPGKILVYSNSIPAQAVRDMLDELCPP